MTDKPDEQRRDDATYEELDAATKSLADALRISFRLLKFVMFGLLVAYLGSGFFQVPAGHRAVVVQLGKIRDLETQPVLEEGAHWAWPWPIGEHIVKDTERTRVADLRSFWFYVPEKYRGRPLDELQRFAPSQLQPGRDGYLLSGEQEIVHLQCQIKYKIGNLVDYLKNVTDEEQIIRTVAEWATIRAVSQMRTDDIVRGEAESLTLKIRDLMQQRLDHLGTGLTVIDVLIPQRTVPLQVRGAYLAVIKAENEKQRTISQARAEATKILNETAGAAYMKIGRTIAEFERAREVGDQQEVERLEKRIFELLEDEAGGRVAKVLGEAQAYRTRILQKVQAEVRRFRELYPKYKENPSIFIQRLWEDVKEEVFTSPDVEVFYLPPGSKEIRLQMNRNPQYLREREMRKYREQVQQGG